MDPNLIIVAAGEGAKAAAGARDWVDFCLLVGLFYSLFRGIQKGIKEGLLVLLVVAIFAALAASTGGLGRAGTAILAFFGFA